MTINQLVTVIFDTVLAVIALATVIELARHPDRARLDIALLFVSLALALLGGPLLQLLNIQFPLFSNIALILFLAEPFLLLRLVVYFQPLAAWVRWSALAGFVLSSALSLFIVASASNPGTLVIIVYFVLVEGYATAAFIAGARQFSGGVRWRMTFAAAGSGWLALIILLAGVSLVLPVVGPVVSPLGQVLAVLAIVSYYLAFAAPAALRRAWQVGELHKFLHDMAGRPIADRVHSGLELLCPAVSRAMGAVASAVYLHQDTPAQFVLRGSDLPDGLPGLLDDSAGPLALAWRERRPIVVPPGGDLGRQLAPAAAKLGAASLVTVPIFNAERTWGVLVAFRIRSSLFPGDDLEILRLLADQAAQALETGELFDQQRALVEQLEAANKELEAFSYSVSHDLRAPLRALDGFSRILLESQRAALSPEDQHYLERIRVNAKRMGELVDDLLAFSRLGRQPLNLTRVEPAAIVAEVWEDLRVERDGRDVELQVDELPPCLADAGLLHQVFINLLGNALKYSRKRDKALIAVGCQTRQPDPTYFVRDNGAGFDPAYTHKLFGVFQRLHRSEEYEGTGVGLAIVARIVQRHGGQVSAESKLDEGATFYFSLKGVPANGATPG